MDKEKVAKGLEEIANDKWMKIHADWYVSVCRDALALLKEQEAVKPHISEAYRCTNGRMARRRAWCGACGLGIRIGSNKRNRSNFCERCGRPVKWE